VTEPEGTWRPDPRQSKAFDRYIENVIGEPDQEKAPESNRPFTDAEFLDAYGLGFNKGWEQGYNAGRSNE